MDKLAEGSGSVSIQQGHDFLDRPHVIAHASLHGRGRGPSTNDHPAQPRHSSPCHRGPHEPRHDEESRAPGRREPLASVYASVIRCR
jgi:hypothetical protein